MVENTKNPVRIDLNEFKLHIHLKNRIQLTLYFNSPSRQFYLSVIALVVNEMKRLGRITSIPLEGHLGLLVLLNETIGESAGSSDKENLLPRIYRKWKDTLPDLENAHLFKILGRRKEYDEGMGRTYPFAEAEKDNWANLFDYQGSEENVRLKFAVDRVGATLDDIVILYEDLLNAEAWEKFILNLQGRKAEHLPEAEAIQSVGEVPKSPGSPMERQKTPWQGRRRWAVLVALIVVITAAVALATWKLYLKPTPDKKASVEKMALPLPDMPSIAVLPFTNMSGEKEQEYFSDGITEDIISALSQIPTLFVIASQSTFTYKGKPVKIQQVGEDLGVRYVLEGSVQRSGDTLRVTAQLIDATTGHHLWSERYDLEMKGIFALQDDITMKVITALQVKLMEGEHARLLAKGTKNLQAYLKFLQAREIFLTVTKEGNVQARRLLEEVIALDPQFAPAYSVLGWITYIDVAVGLSKSPYESYKQAFELAKKAVAMDDSFPTAHSLLGFLHVVMGRQYDKGIAECERAIALAPNSASAHIWMGQVLMLAGRHEEAIRHSEQALRLDPIAPGLYYRNLGSAYFYAGRYEEAVAAHKKSLNRAPNDILTHLALTTAYSWAGRLEEARAQAAEVLRIKPNFSVEERAKMGLYKNQADLERYLEGLRKAGLK
jgi:TolB-like protein/Tfp pilus assembly protein PilF